MTKDIVFDLGKKKKAVVSSFKGKTLVHIREFYTNDEGKELPGKKGISLTADVFNNLFDVMPKIRDAVNGTTESNIKDDDKTIPSKREIVDDDDDEEKEDADIDNRSKSGDKNVSDNDKPLSDKRLKADE